VIVETPQKVSRQMLILLLSLAISTLAGFLPDWTGSPFSAADQTLLSIGLFCTFVLLDILHEVTKTSAEFNRQHSLWTLRDPGETELANIRAHFDEIVNDARGKSDLFVNHFVNDFRRLAKKAEDAAAKKELRIVSDYYLNDDEVFEAFLSGQQDPVLRYTWPIGNNDRLFEEHAWRRYFEVIANMASKGKVASIRVILVLEDLQLAKNARLGALFDFYKAASQQEARHIDRNNFQTISMETGIPTHFLDFGIYGQQMLFRSEQYQPEYTGTFSKDKNLIATYVKFFDTLWDSTGVMKKNPATGGRVLSLEQLVEIDGTL
jgi:hypothetical protein